MLEQNRRTSRIRPVRRYVLRENEVTPEELIDRADTILLHAVEDNMDAILCDSGWDLVDRSDGGYKNCYTVDAGQDGPLAQKDVRKIAAILDRAAKQISRELQCDLDILDGPNLDPDGTIWFDAIVSTGIDLGPVQE